METSVDTLKFGRVAPGTETVKSATVTAANDLGIEVENVLILSGGGAFTIESVQPNPADGPVTLARGETMTINIKFKPGAERDYSSRIVITGNDFRSSAQFIFLAGTGDASAGVDEEPVSGAAQLSLKVVPSTVNGHGMLFYNTGSARRERVMLTLVDVSGNRVRTLLDETVAGGEGEVSFDTGGLAAGTYYVVLRSGERLVAEEVKVVK